MNKKKPFAGVKGYDVHITYAINNKPTSAFYADNNNTFSRYFYRNT